MSLASHLVGQNTYGNFKQVWLGLYSKPEREISKLASKRNIKVNFKKKYHLNIWCPFRKTEDETFGLLYFAQDAQVAH